MAEDTRAFSVKSWGGEYSEFIQCNIIIFSVLLKTDSFFFPVFVVVGRASGQGKAGQWFFFRRAEGV